ncbi:glucose sorbosone dehydrogenase [Corynebacterium deserti GIMN1.010]|uniref:Glucose sorbosone dehydrogenase n=2 Tax=Corynebacterium TaxID=1716 RepID=A0A0M3Q8T6_9CORY|nr:glucose sorbosone dehydrogenase [Corynebacterium deserti GIMN1.010]
MLYATTGDAGKILRITSDGQGPDDNPLPSSDAYSLGRCNPQGIAWDDDGTIYSSEFGQNTWDELNIIEDGSNYGWPTVEGIEEEDGFVDPIQQWRPSDASPSGMAIVHGSIWIANLRGERLREIPLDDPTVSTDLWVGEYGRLRDVVV